ncbi:hypothetical protein C1Y63_10455 [Corynebacterium sp. 13CS0277]|uniref:BRO-N domain-containing protein n=1 Tax=Corynebacterium sp. 13CS0277 TaxID=2071994 RepID=UPI000D0272D8|nr:Bro-N domain-containing protein [Corynebacterium sp. 13CS0277]PRQ10607.1 hypothetical protein C1Y63_10455 [Corynebacterium sp. 13CS0277]
MSDEIAETLTFDGVRIRILRDEDGSRWFSARDVARSLKYKRGSASIRHLCPDHQRGEYRRIRKATRGYAREPFISEDDVMAVAANSGMPAAYLLGQAVRPEPEPKHAAGYLPNTVEALEALGFTPDDNAYWWVGDYLDATAQQRFQGIIRAGIYAWASRIALHITPTSINFQGLRRLANLTADEAGQVIRYAELTPTGGWFPLEDTMRALMPRGRCSYQGCTHPIAIWSELGLCDNHERNAQQILKETQYYDEARAVQARRSSRTWY